jgi:hypothetical protein
MSILAIFANAAQVRAKAGCCKVRWKKPKVRHLKVNVDGSFHQEVREGVVGVVIQDCEGNIIATSSVFISNIASAALVEAMAMREGLA